MSSGGVRAFWVANGPMVVFSQIGDVTVVDFEEAVKGAVNDVIALAEGVDVPAAESDPGAQAEATGAPTAAPAAPVISAARQPAR